MTSAPRPVYSGLVALLAPRKAPAPDERKLVLFGIGSVIYGVAIESVREVVNPQPVITLPHAPPSVVGVTHHRGEVVPVVDLRHRFGLTDAAPDPRRVKWIMLDAAVAPGAPTAAPAPAPRPLAAIVDEVLTVFPTHEALRPAPSLGGGDDVRGILGVVTANAAALTRSGSPRREQLVFVLDLDRLRRLIEPVDRPGAATGPTPSRGATTGQPRESIPAPALGGSTSGALGSGPPHALPQGGGGGGFS